MHPISLKFLDQDIEAKFQIANEEKFKSQYKWLVFSLIIAMSILDILEIIDKNYTQIGFNSAFLIVLFILSWALYINSERALKIVETFNNSFCLPPALNILTSIYNLIEFKTGIALVLMSMLYAHTYNKNYNIVQTSISMVVFIFICIGHISYLIGFTPYYFIILGPIILTISQMYSSIKIERLNFSQSQVNQSLVDVITKVCKENIIIFTYNLEQHKYEKEIINETAQFYFNTDILSDILKEIHIKNQREDIDIQSFVFKNCIQQQKRGEFELQGYYKSKTKKILIKLYVTQYLNIQIILKIEKQEEKIIKIRKAKKLINFQLCFLQTLLKKFSECFRIQEGIDIPQFKFYNYLHKSIIYNKLQILSMVTCPQIIIQTINLEQMIGNVFGAWNLKYFLKTKYHEIPETSRQIQDCDGSVMNTSKIHIELLLQVVAIVLRKIILNYQEFILIELEYSQDIILLNFNFNSKNYIQKIGYLKENLANLICLLGIKESYQFQENTISFKILKQLNEFG